MTDHPKSSPTPVNNQGEPHEWDVDTVRSRLRHSSKWTRWAAAREVYFRQDVQSRDTLVDLLQNDPDNLVRQMASQALGALYDAGVEIPLYAHLADHSRETQKEVAIARLKELGVEVSQEEDHFRLMIPHKFRSPVYLEIGYLMGQLVDAPFPDHFAPFTDVPSLQLPDVQTETIDFVDSYPHGLKFRIYPNGKNPRR